MTGERSTQVLRHGRDEPPPPRRELRAGRLSVVFEQGDLRSIRLGDREILRRVYVAIRDQKWDTILPRLSDLQIEAGPDRFRISYLSEHVQGPVDFAWRGTIVGDERGTITFTMDGEVRATFQRARIGLCILHPVDGVAGAPYRAEHDDGATEEGRFPAQIAPHQPLLDLRAISHQVVPGVWAEVRFAGDVWEMEDHRNWTDASFKTYSTPLRLPWPVEVRRGEMIRQSVTISLHGTPSGQQAAPESVLTLRVGSRPRGPLPRIGLGSASHGQPLTAREIQRLKRLRLAHLRVDLVLDQPGWEQALGRADAEATALGVPLEVALLVDDGAEQQLRALRTQIERVRPSLTRWLILHRAEQARSTTSPRWVALARAVLASAAPAATFGIGANANFTELNRNRPPLDVADFVFYSITPQVHAFDNASLVENLQAQSYTVESARAFCGDLPLVISPVTLRPRFNQIASGPPPAPAPGELPGQVDPRQMSLFGAAWTLGSLKYLAESGVSSVTYYETSGWRGVMETEAGASAPQAFRSIPGAVFPLYHVLADVGDFAGGQLLPATSSNTLALDGLALGKDGRVRVLLANLTPEVTRLHVSGLGGRVRLCLLDETNAEPAMRDAEGFRAQAGETRETDSGVLDLELRPYALARIDSED